MLRKDNSSVSINGNGAQQASGVHNDLSSLTSKTTNPKIGRCRDSSCLKLLQALCVELEQAETKPNVIVVNKVALSKLRSDFPWIFNGNVLIYNSREMLVLPTDENVIGLCFGFYQELE